MQPAAPVSAPAAVAEKVAEAPKAAAPVPAAPPAAEEDAPGGDAALGLDVSIFPEVEREPAPRGQLEERSGGGGPSPAAPGAGRGASVSRGAAGSPCVIELSSSSSSL